MLLNRSLFHQATPHFESDMSNTDVTSPPPVIRQDESLDVDLHEFPILPSPTSEEMEELSADQPIGPVEVDDWGLPFHLVVPFPPFPTYGEYRGDVDHWELNRGGELVQVTVRNLMRDQIKSSLKYHHYIWRYLSINRALLQTHGEQALSKTPVFPSVAQKFTDINAPVALTDLEKAQKEFAQNHSGISETLLNVHSYSVALGLPGYDTFRCQRNFYSHTFLTPEVENTSRYENLQTTMKGIQAQYEPLWKLVTTNITTLETQLANKKIWREPPPLRRRPPVEEACGAQDSTTWYDKQDSDPQESTEEKNVEAKKSRFCWPVRYLFKHSKKVRNLAGRVGKRLIDMQSDAEYQRYLEEIIGDTQPTADQSCKGFDDGWGAEAPSRSHGSGRGAEDKGEEFQSAYI
jgi:hypothetical protein